jgi:tetratricopeptide (TPR) repeat protein
MLGDEQRRLDRLVMGDRQVRAAFLVSYRQLSESEARLFRHLGLHPGPHFSGAAAARLANVERSIAEEMLERLVLVHLVIEDDSGRFQLHDLLRLFARETCHTMDSDTDCRAALGHIMDYYFGMANYVACCLNPRCRLKLAEVNGSNAASIPSPLQAVAWFETERPNLLAALSLAVGEEWHEKVWELGARLGEPLELLSHLDDLLMVRQAALDAAQAAGPRFVQAAALGYLGMAYLKMRRFGEASTGLQTALAVFRELGDRQGQAVTLGRLGTVSAQLRHFDEAADRFGEAMAIYREKDDRHGRGTMATNLGNIHLEQRKFDEAIECYFQGLEAFRESGDCQAEAQTANNLGDVYGESGQFEEAIGWFNQALATYREIGDLHGTGVTLANLGNAYFCLKLPEKAIDYYEAYAKLSLKKYRPMAARNEDRNVFSGLL